MLPLAHLLACLRCQPVGSIDKSWESSDLIFVPVEHGDYSRQEDLCALLDDIIGLLRSDPDLFSNRILEDFIPNVADFISMNATIDEGTGPAALLRRNVMTNISQVLTSIGGLPDLPPLLQEQVSHIEVFLS